jgi:hypothetical protein
VQVGIEVRKVWHCAASKNGCQPPIPRISQIVYLQLCCGDCARSFGWKTCVASSPVCQNGGGSDEGSQDFLEKCNLRFARELSASSICHHPLPPSYESSSDCSSCQRHAPRLSFFYHLQINLPVLPNPSITFLQSICTSTSYRSTNCPLHSTSVAILDRSRA